MVNSFLRHATEQVARKSDCKECYDKLRVSLDIKLPENNSTTSTTPAAGSGSQPAEKKEVAETAVNGEKPAENNTAKEQQPPVENAQGENAGQQGQ